ncbi:colostrum trypsin inhibitor-like [Amblyomma americanum]
MHHLQLTDSLAANSSPAVYPGGIPRKEGKPYPGTRSYYSVTLLPWWKLSQPAVCSEPKVVGPCEAAMSRFFYNATSQACEHFVYGGCRGNGNNFRTEQECQETCEPHQVVLPRA